MCHRSITELISIDGQISSNLWAVPKGIILTLSIITPVLVCSSFSASDDHGAVSADLSIQINLCACNLDHGTCDFCQLQEGWPQNTLFRIVACQCDVGWGGEWPVSVFDWGVGVSGLSVC